MTRDLNEAIAAGSDAVREARLTRRVDDLTRANRVQLGEIEKLSEQLKFHHDVADLNPRAMKWATPKKPKSRDAVVMAMLSDLHLDEVVRAEDMGGVNEYSREIAEDRLRTWTREMCQLPSIGPSSDIAGLVLMLGGDVLNGDIHEGRQTNEDTLLGSMLHWSEIIASAILTVADFYPHIHIPTVTGNHGRMTMKPRFKLRARDNADWHLAHLIARTVGKDERITFDIPESPDCQIEVMGKQHILTHGDSTTGGSGIGGIFPPVKRMVARKTERYASYGTSVDHVWLGHFHQYISGGNFHVNGSMKGYDEYASGHNFLPEPPQQAVAYVTERGIEWDHAIILD